MQRGANFCLQRKYFHTHRNPFLKVVRRIQKLKKNVKNNSTFFHKLYTGKIFTNIFIKKYNFNYSHPLSMWYIHNGRKATWGVCRHESKGQLTVSKNIPRSSNAKDQCADPTRCTPIWCTLSVVDAVLAAKLVELTRLEVRVGDKPRMAASTTILARSSRRKITFQRLRGLLGVEVLLGWQKYSLVLRHEIYSRISRVTHESKSPNKKIHRGSIYWSELIS